MSQGFKSSDTQSLKPNKSLDVEHIIPSLEDTSKHSNHSFSLPKENSPDFYLLLNFKQNFLQESFRSLSLTLFSHPLWNLLWSWEPTTTLPFMFLHPRRVLQPLKMKGSAGSSSGEGERFLSPRLQFLILQGTELVPDTSLLRKPKHLF